MILTVGTRGSRLSLLQTRSVVELLKAMLPELEVRERIFETLGDRETEKPLYLLRQRGIFEKEIDQAVLRGEVDFAVHSLKDVPVGEEEGGGGDLILALIPRREIPNDALVSRQGLGLRALPTGSTVGTSSLRRMAQVKYLRPDLEVEPIRGNIETRLDKLGRGEFDAVVLAEAGPKRMGLGDRITERLSLEDFTPAAGQGALAVVTRRDREDVIRLLERAEDRPSRIEVSVERSLMARLGSVCRIPVGVVARMGPTDLRLYASVFSVDGREKIDTSCAAEPESADVLVSRAFQELSERGLDRIVEGWSERYETG